MDKLTSLIEKMSVHLVTQASLISQQALPPARDNYQRPPSRNQYQRFFPRAQDSRSYNRSQQGPIKCYHCNGEGHISWNCQNPCYICKRKNHLGQRCQQPPPI